MTHTREDMQAALKEAVVPYLRSVGFKGSLPHFYRTRGDRIDALTVQYSRSGHCLLIEIYAVINEPGVIPAKPRTHRYSGHLRLFSGNVRNDHWFCFTPYGCFAPMQAPQEIARQFVTLLSTQADNWWMAHTPLAANNSFKPKPLRGSA